MYKLLLVFCIFMNTKQQSRGRPVSEIVTNYKINNKIPITNLYAEMLDDTASNQNTQLAEKELYVLFDQYNVITTWTIVTGENLIKQIQDFAAKHDICINFLQDMQNNIAADYTFQDKTVFEILNILCDIMKWRMSIDGKNIILSKDKPYIFTHSLTALNIKNMTATNTSANTTDSSSINTSNRSYSDVWNEITQFLFFLTSDRRLSLKANTSTDKDSPEEEIPYLNTSTSSKSKLPSYHDMMPENEKDPFKSDNVFAINKTKTSTSCYVINQHAGIITLYATQAEHKAFAKYLHSVEKKLNLQVRFEGKIFSLNSNNLYNVGLDINTILGKPMKNVINAWNTKKITDNLFTADTVQTTNADKPATNADKPADKEISLSDIFSFLMQFGTVHTLSNPQITIAHNQIGIFKYTTNKIYKHQTIEESDSLVTVNPANKSKKPYETYVPKKIIRENIDKIPVGFTLCIQPAVDNNTGNIYVHIVQRIIGIDDHVQSDTGNNQYPIIAHKELDTKIRLKPGVWIALGGYICKQKTKDKNFGFFGAKTSANNDFEEILLIMRGTPLYYEVTSLNSRYLELYQDRS